MKLGQILLSLNYISTEDLAKALVMQETQKTRGQKPMKIGHLLLMSNLIDNEKLVAALRQQTSKAQASRRMVIQAKEQQRESSTPTEVDEDSAWGKIKGILFKKI